MWIVIFCHHCHGPDCRQEMSPRSAAWWPFRPGGDRGSVRACSWWRARAAAVMPRSAKGGRGAGV